MTESQTASPLPSTTHIPELGVVPLQPSASVSAITTSTSPAPTGETRSDDISPMVTTSSPLPAVEQSETAEVAPVPIPTNSPQEPPQSEAAPQQDVAPTADSHRPAFDSSFQPASASGQPVASPVKSLLPLLPPQAAFVPNAIQPNANPSNNSNLNASVPVDNGSPLVAVIGGVLGGLVVALLAVGFVVARMRRRKQHSLNQSLESGYTPSHLASLESYNKSLSHAPREELVDYHIQEQNFASYYSTAQVAESTIASPAPRVELDLEEKQFFDPFRINAVDGKPLQQISLENRNTAISTASSMDEMTLDPRYTVRMSDFYASTISAHSMNDTDDADTILSLDLESVN